MGESKTRQKLDPTTQNTNQPQSSSWLSLPAPIRLVFDQFPKVAYEANQLPQRSFSSRSIHSLHIFSHSNAELSPNPACLKWQLYLRIHRIPFSTHPSSNHASPTGALPFLLPAITSTREPPPQTITASKIQRWAESQGAMEEKFDMKLDAYSSLVDQNIRNAWLFNLYLHPQNFECVARCLYVQPASTNTAVRATLSHQLQEAARDQLLRTTTLIDIDEIYEQAVLAFEALAILLGDYSFFSKSEVPCLFDASLVSFTHLILEFADRGGCYGISWKDDTLSELLFRYPRLVGHRDRVLQFSGCKSKG